MKFDSKLIAAIAVSLLRYAVHHGPKVGGFTSDLTDQLLDRVRQRYKSDTNAESVNAVWHCANRNSKSCKTLSFRCGLPVPANQYNTVVVVEVPWVLSTQKSESDTTRQGFR